MKLKSIMQNRKAQLGMDTVTRVAIAFLILAVIGIAIILALVSLRDSNIFADQSTEFNQTTSITNNVSEGLETFFGNTGTIFSILVVVVIILAITLIILAVRRFGGGAGGSL